MQTEKDAPGLEFARLFGEYLVGPLNRFRFQPVVFLKLRSEVGHLLGRVLQPGLLTGGLDGILAGILRHAEDGVRVEHVLGVDARGPAPLTALLLFLFFPVRVLFPLTRLLFLPEARGFFLPRSLTALFLFARALLRLFFG